MSQKTQKKQQDQGLPEITGDSTSSLKLGHFSLSTKNFWLVLVCIFCLFILSIIWTNIYFYNKITTKFFQHEDKVIQLLQKKIEHFHMSNSTSK